MMEAPSDIAARVDRSEPLLEARDLCVDYITEKGNLRACDHVDLTLHRGEILGIAGESACGKSTLLAALGRLQRPPAVTSAGKVIFHPFGGQAVDLTAKSESQLEEFRWADIAIVMQSAMACLNPVTRLEAQFTDVIRRHDREVSKAQASEQAANLLRMVGIPSQRLTSYPYELSGGMQQRALIALSLACNPEIVLMDEPTTAVDVVMQRQILVQMLDLQAQLGFAIAFVTHDLSLLLEISDRIAIMYAGRIVEIGTAEQLYHAPRHPYTQGLRNAFPPLSEPVRRLTGIPGAPPNLLNLPTGCAFHPRCPKSEQICVETSPALADVPSGKCACHFPNMAFASGSDAAQGAAMAGASLDDLKGDRR
ncbi:MAG: ABC transporter ATP-binding protein [Candidatus Nanopelagicales bacterium]